MTGKELIEAAAKRAAKKLSSTRPNIPVITSEFAPHAELIEAAREVRCLRDAQAARTKAWQQLAVDAKNPEIDRAEIEQRRRALDTVVVDFSTVIERVCDALTAAEKLGEQS